MSEARFFVGRRVNVFLNDLSKLDRRSHEGVTLENVVGTRLKFAFGKVPIDHIQTMYPVD